MHLADARACTDGLQTSGGSNISLEGLSDGMQGLQWFCSTASAPAWYHSPINADDAQKSAVMLVTVENLQLTGAPSKHVAAACPDQSGQRKHRLLEHSNCCKSQNTGPHVAHRLISPILLP